MPFEDIQLNDGKTIPGIAFGTGSSMKNQDVTEYIEKALENGFSHVDTAQIYGTEQYVGQALHDESVDRKDLFVTTKYDGEGKVIDSLKTSLKKLGLKYVDLYLVHFPQAVEGTVENTWREMEKAQAAGLTKSIGVSNFSASQLRDLLKTANVKPAVNQIKLHPYNWASQRETVEYAQEKGIVIEAYSPLTPITRMPDGPLDPVLDSISKRLDATPAQVLFAWLRAKGVIIITTTRKVSRLEEYLGAGELAPLLKEDISAIEDAASQSSDNDAFEFQYPVYVYISSLFASLTASLQPIFDALPPMPEIPDSFEPIIENARWAIEEARNLSPGQWALVILSAAVMWDLMRVGKMWRKTARERTARAECMDHIEV